MTTLERRLAQTFRAARWAKSGGQPVCPTCFDGDDLATPVPDALMPGLLRYRCRLCRVAFADSLGTPFFSRKPGSLRVAAMIVLEVDPRTIGLSPAQILRAWAMVARVKRSAMAAAWRAELHRTGITERRLRRALAPNPEAA